MNDPQIQHELLHLQVVAEVFIIFLIVMGILLS